MSCGCKGSSKLPNDGKWIAKQLQEVKRCRDGNEAIDVYPLTIVQAIRDVCSGKRLDEILVEGNHLYVVPGEKGLYDGLTSVDKRQRRKGLVVTSVNNKGKTITLQYTGTGDSDEEFGNPLNWEPFGGISPAVEPSVPTDELEAIKRRLDALERKQDKYAVSGKYINSTDIRITMSDGSTFDIVKPKGDEPAPPPPVPPTPEPPKPTERVLATFRLYSEGSVGAAGLSGSDRRRKAKEDYSPVAEDFANANDMTVVDGWYSVTMMHDYGKTMFAHIATMGTVTALTTKGAEAINQLANFNKHELLIDGVAYVAYTQKNASLSSENGTTYILRF